MELSISEIYRFRFTTIELLFEIITASGFSQADLREPIFEEAFGGMMVTLITYQSSFHLIVCLEFIFFLYLRTDLKFNLNFVRSMTNLFINRDLKDEIISQSRYFPGCLKSKHSTKTIRCLRSVQMQGTEIEGRRSKPACLPPVTEPVLRQVQQSSKVTWLLSNVEAQQLGTYKIPPLLQPIKNKKQIDMTYIW
mgnify:CR=1 FL=1|jgi:hypothetical protein